MFTYKTGNNLRKEKGFSAINIPSDMAIRPLPPTCYITLFVIPDELSFYDRYKRACGSHLPRSISDLHIQRQRLLQHVYAPPMGPSMVTDYPQIENAVRIQSQNDMGGQKRRRDTDRT